MDPGNQLCDLCISNTAEVFCSCVRPVTLLCPTCVSQHSIKRQGRAHTTWALDKLPFVKLPGLLERLQQRTEALAELRENAWKSVRDVDQAINQYGETVEKVIEEYSTKVDREVLDLQQRIYQIVTKAKRTVLELTTQQQQQVERLNQVKAELTAQVQLSLDEMEHTLTEDKPHLRSRYGPSFRQILGNMQPFQLFSFYIQTSVLPSVTLITQLHAPNEIVAQSKPAEISSNASREQFTGVFGNKVELYNVKSLKSTRFTLSVNFGVGGCFVDIDDSTRLCIGAYPPSTGVYALNLISQKLTSMPALRTPRAYAGVAKTANFVYVFGGFDGSAGLKSNEKYHIAEKQWLPLADMHRSRSGFTPCYYHSLIYLVDTYIYRIMESFDPERETFTELPVFLPSQLELGCDCAAFIANGELCVLTEAKQIARWKIDSEAGFRLYETKESCWSSQPPMVIGSMVFLANACSGRVDRFNLETNAFA